MNSKAIVINALYNPFEVSLFTDLMEIKICCRASKSIRIRIFNDRPSEPELAWYYEIARHIISFFAFLFYPDVFLQEAV
jgi:hypothetical protein